MADVIDHSGMSTDEDEGPNSDTEQEAVWRDDNVTKFASSEQQTNTPVAISDVDDHRGLTRRGSEMIAKELPGEFPDRALTSSPGVPSSSFTPSPWRGAVNELYRGPRAVPSTGRCASPPTDNREILCDFWNAGEYEKGRMAMKMNAPRRALDHVRVHPKFLHSNATSHKWALGAVAELLDNVVDEIQNGATFARVDVIVNPRDGSPVLLVQDNGGGMSPDCMRQCLGFGYSSKNTAINIGKYGNGFKTSTMRLGADAILFSRCSKESSLSVGMLSYTFLRQIGVKDVMVPTIHYEVSPVKQLCDETPRRMIQTTHQDWISNLEILTQWSPFSSELELLEQCLNIGLQGTVVIIYNLWLNDDGLLELDFDSDESDIRLRISDGSDIRLMNSDKSDGRPSGGAKSHSPRPVQHQLAENHITNKCRYSLRAYTSILYLTMPPGFQIILRGKAVEHHLLASDLKFCESIVYKPHAGNLKAGGAMSRSISQETSVTTIIGFTKEAPLLNVHGFSVYHKNRLIMPFWRVFHDNSSRGRGVMGVLEANFIEPAHDKQDFERTGVLLRLEARLKRMTVEYWNLHGHLVGYQSTKGGKLKKLAAAETENLLSFPTLTRTITPAAHPSFVSEGPAVALPSIAEPSVVRPPSSVQALEPSPAASEKPSSTETEPFATALEPPAVYMARGPYAAARGPSVVAREPSAAESGPSTAAPRPSAAAPRPSAAAPRPSAAAPRPSAAAPRPSAAAPRPSAAAPRPSDAAPRPSATAPGPSVAAPGLSLVRSEPPLLSSGSLVVAPGSVGLAQDYIVRGSGLVPDWDFDALAMGGHGEDFADIEAPRLSPALISCLQHKAFGSASKSKPTATEASSIWLHHGTLPNARDLDKVQLVDENSYLKVRCQASKSKPICMESSNILQSSMVQPNAGGLDKAQLVDENSYLKVRCQHYEEKFWALVQENHELSEEALQLERRIAELEKEIQAT